MSPEVATNLRGPGRVRDWTPEHGNTVRLVEDEINAGRTEAENRFLATLLPGRPRLMVWPRSDVGGAPWLCVSLDFSEGNRIQRTLRLDFDGTSLRGGWSPGFLNWDDGVRAEDAGVDTLGPDGLALDTPDADEAGRTAGRWFDDHIARWGRT